MSRFSCTRLTRENLGVRAPAHSRRHEAPVPLRSINTTIRTLGGLTLGGTLVTPDSPIDRAVVFVHGGGVTREEGGFFTRLATGLGEAGVATLRYDLRGHGRSEGLPQETTLASHLNDIRVALANLREATG